MGRRRNLYEAEGERRKENMWGRVGRAGHAGGAARLVVFFINLSPRLTGGVGAGCLWIHLV